MKLLPPVDSGPHRGGPERRRRTLSRILLSPAFLLAVPRSPLVPDPVREASVETARGAMDRRPARD
jgi:hypothetical protein